MTPLERELLLLGETIAYPDVPGLAAAVRERIERRRPLPRGLVLAFATAVLALAVAFAVPPARGAILDLFRGVPGVEIRRVPGRPRLDMLTARVLGVPASAEEAARALGFRPLRPAEEDVVLYLDRVLPAVTYAWTRKRLLLTEFRGEAIPFVRKSAGPGTRIEEVTVGLAGGYWLSGERHLVVFRDGRGRIVQSRAAGNVLIWEQDGITLRLEGPRTLGEALAIAGTLRPAAV